MDYKKKYEKLVDAVKVLRDNNPSDEGIQNWVNDNVPELKESEDDRIRKDIIALLHFGLTDGSSVAPGCRTTKEQAIAWLEKQGNKTQGKSALEAIRDEKVDNANKIEPKDYSSIDPYFGKPIDNVEPKFKVGDEIKYKYPTADTSTLTIIKVECDKNRYVVCDKPNNFCFLSFFAQDNFNFISKTKFDITTLKPYDKVLVRDCNEDKWNIDFFGYYRDNGTYQCMTFTKNQCIPYEGNEHLLGKKDDCDEFYKTWE